MPQSLTFNLDCIQGMKSFPDAFFDLAIVDPPYGIGESGGKVRTRKKFTVRERHKKKNWDDSPPPPEYWKELFRVSKNQIVWGANHFTPFLPPSRGWVFWEKKIGGDYSDGELAYTSFNRPLRMCTKWNNPKRRIHPTQKPVELYQWLLREFASPGDKILDTHLGSGSSRIACFQLGFDFWGYELDSEYFALEEKRFSQVQGVFF